MSDEIKSPEEILAERYPSLFTEVVCGVSIGLGWVPIICDLADAILSAGASVTIEQVKEKFGGLRFYYSGDNIDHLVDLAEIRCALTCEFCGAPGKATRSGWIKTLCASHTAAWTSRR